MVRGNLCILIHLQDEPVWTLVSDLPAAPLPTTPLAVRWDDLGWAICRTPACLGSGNCASTGAGEGQGQGEEGRLPLKEGG